MTATSVLAQATYNPSSSYPTTSTSCIPIFYHLSDIYRRTGVPRGVVHELGNAVTPSYSSVSTAHTPYSGGYSSGASSGVSGGTPSSPLERFDLGGEREPAQQQQERERGRAGYNAYSTTGYATPSRERYATLAAPVNGSTTQYAPGSTTTYAPGTSSPTPQYTTLGATPRSPMARYEYLSGQAQGVGQGWWGSRWDFYFYTLASSPVSSTSTSASSTISESCSASEESTSESESEGEEERYDAPAYTERSTDFATRHSRLRTAPRHRYLSSPASAASDDGCDSDKGGAEMAYVPGSSKLAHVDLHTRAAPQHADHHATGSSSDTQHNSGDTRAWTVEQARRMRRLRVVPPDPSAQACRPQQQQW
ncbi:hypothetical protein C8J57DRAFT_1519442 [Mycena rebaudengoi]|nr:hypothetical protein C8J57DRAFT_1519442 [Mycena rebaudengoi]